MPTPIDVDYLDGEFTVSEQEPGSIAEVVELLGEEAVRRSAIDDNRYRNKYPRVYRKVSEEVTKLGHKRPQAKDEKTGELKVKKTKDGAETPILVSANDHLRDYLETGGEDARKVLGELFARIANEEPLFVKGERAGGGGKVSQAHLDAANGMIADGSAEGNAEIIESMVPGYKLGRDADSQLTAESLARGIQALEKHLQNEAKNKAKGLFAKKA